MLSLYYKPTCGFSRKVIDFADENGVELELMDINEDDETLQELIEKGGKQQVPFLFDDDKGQGLYESGDIIAYLQEHYAQEGGAVAATVGAGKPRIHVGGTTCEACEG